MTETTLTNPTLVLGGTGKTSRPAPRFLPFRDAVGAGDRAG
jgi:hypothetical protein